MEVSKTVREFQPDLILLDINMPSVAGERMCEVLKKSSFGRDIPIVLYTGQEEEEVKKITEKVKADGYIIKQMDKAVIVNEVDFYYKKFHGSKFSQ